MKNQKGITLVALVITIIVLLILAGVSISLVVGNNGVLTQASSSVITNNVAAAKEDVTMALAACETKYYTKWAQNSATTRANIYQNEYTLKDELDTKGYFVEVKDAAPTAKLTAHGALTGLVGTTTKWIVVTKKTTNETYGFKVKGGLAESSGSYTLDPAVTYIDAKGTSQTVNV